MHSSETLLSHEMTLALYLRWQKKWSARSRNRDSPFPLEGPAASLVRGELLYRYHRHPRSERADEEPCPVLATFVLSALGSVPRGVTISRHGGQGGQSPSVMRCTVLCSPQRMLSAIRSHNDEAVLACGSVLSAFFLACPGFPERQFFFDSHQERTPLFINPFDALVLINKQREKRDDSGASERKRCHSCV